MLKRFRLAGVSYDKGQENMEDLHLDGLLDVGTQLEMIREPENPYDQNAIRIRFTVEKPHYYLGVEKIHYYLGYVPKNEAKELAPMIDAGRHLKMVVGDIITYYGSVANLNVTVTNNDD